MKPAETLARNPLNTNKRQEINWLRQQLQLKQKCRAGDRGRRETVHSPLFFCEIGEIESVLALMAAILISKCTERAGVGDYSRFLPNRLPPAP